MPPPPAQVYERESLLKILANPNHSKHLLKFAEQKFSAENVLFYRRTTSVINMGQALLRNAVFAEKVPPLMRIELIDIYNSFIVDGAKHELNLTIVTARNIKQAFESGEFGIGVFDKAREEVLDLLHFNLYRVFMKTQESMQIRECLSAEYAKPQSNRVKKLLKVVSGMIVKPNIISARPSEC